MINTPFYLPTLLPQWGIFAGVVMLTIGYVDKRNIWTLLGWITLILAGLTSLYFNLFGGLTALGESSGQEIISGLITSTGWQSATGGALAICSLLLYHYKSKRYPILGILTVIYFVLIFFLFTQVSALSGKNNKPDNQPQSKQQIK